MSVIIHPRPSPLAAAMYTLRDLDADVIVLHGPSGCCFRPARLLEKDGVKVITTALTDDDFVFGAEQKLVKVLQRVEELFKPRLIGLVGSCASMIIGEDLKKVAKEAGVYAKTICCNVHSGSGDNTVGAVMVLKEAASLSFIAQEEFERQQKMLEMATDLERTRGTARGEYLEPVSGDNPIKVAQEITKLAKTGARIDCVLNAKKETVYLYADVLLAMHKLAQKTPVKIRYIANLDENVGLPRIRLYASTVRKALQDQQVNIDYITGGLDEYPLTGITAKEIVQKNQADLVIIAGIPHAVALETSMKCVAVTVGTRAISNLKTMGYTYAVADRDAHAVSLGTDKHIQQSLFGHALRKVVEKI